jgi:glutamate racemase
LPKIRQYLPANVKVLAQGGYVARSLSDYLRRHPEMECRITRGGTARFLTTEQSEVFSHNASLFLGHAVQAEHIAL